MDGWREKSMVDEINLKMDQRMDGTGKRVDELRNEW